MKLASTRLIAADIKAMVTFYEMVTGLRAEWLAPVPGALADMARRPAGLVPVANDPYEKSSHQTAHRSFTGRLRLAPPIFSVPRKDLSHDFSSQVALEATRAVRFDGHAHLQSVLSNQHRLLGEDTRHRALP
jgi:hypothetical protein